ncbi:hypothetical protein [Fervidicoccus sp.]|uniref:hypothetical protein n=1 Tax=Fervidicoccus sp. TaxID=2060324 RepID=UPI003D0C461C
MNLKQIAGMIITFLGIILMFYSYLANWKNGMIAGDDAYTFVAGTIFLIAGPGFWIGEVPKEVAARVRTEILGAKKEIEKGEKK